MADRKISDLTALTTPATGDLLPIVDISEAAAADKNKSITVGELLRGAPDGTAAAPGIAFESDPNSGIYSPGADQVAISTGGSGRLFVDASGRVGAGGSPTAYQLESRVSGNNGISINNSGNTGTDYCVLDFTQNGAQKGVVYTNNNNFTINAPAGPFYIQTNGSNALVVDSSQRVGLGTSSPAFKFQINNSGTSPATIASFRNTALDYVYMELNDQTGNSTYLGSESGKFVVQTPGSSYATKFCITSAGNVGVGTTSPDYKLTVADTSSYVIANLKSSTTEFCGLYFGDTDAVGRGTIVYDNSVDAMTFRTNGSGEDMRIDSSGRVGIGTSSPTLSSGTGLHLRDSNTGIRLNPSSDGGQGYIEFADESNTVRYTSGYRDANTTYNICPGSDLSVASGFHIDTSGRLGIGTTSPSSPLTVEQSSSNVNLELHSTGSGRGAQIKSHNDHGTFYHGLAGDTTGNFLYYTADAKDHVFYTNNIERARIDSSGRLLVGRTTSPTGTLSIAGRSDGAALPPFLRLDIANATPSDGAGLGVLVFGTTSDTGENRGANITALRDGGTWTANSSLPTRLAFYTTADGSATPTERMRITNDGSFAFGRTTAREFFDINGKVIINHAGTSNQNLFALATNPTHGVAMLLDNAGTSTGRTFVLSCARTATSAWRFLECSSGNNATTVGGDAEFRLDGDGNGFADNNWNSGGADYAEYFEWFDGNTTAEDRRGISVVLDGDKIREAVAGEDPIGVISGNPSVVGDSGWNKWSGKHLRDDFNSYLREEYSVIEWIDEEGTTKSYPSDDVPKDEIIPVDAITKTVDDKGNLLTRRILNPDFDPDQEYIPREERPEWDCVGLMGKLRIRKGQVTGARWIKMRNISDTVEEWLVR